MVSKAAAAKRSALGGDAAAAVAFPCSADRAALRIWLAVSPHASSKSRKASAMRGRSSWAACDVRAEINAANTSTARWSSWRNGKLWALKSEAKRDKREHAERSRSREGWRRVGATRRSVS
eukprot:scaffold187054_cov27-Tisochrysis_lutea.AAC.4